MKKLLLLASIPLSILLLAGPMPLLAQDFGDLYGSQNLQSVAAGYGPLIAPAGGSGGEVMFSFNTSSQQTEASETYKYFYGVGLGGGYLGAPEVDLGKYDDRDIGAGYGKIQLEFKLFATTRGDVRPFLGGALGYGSGAFWAEHIKGEEDPPGSAEMYFAGLEGGLHFPIQSGYALTIGIGADARVLLYGSESIAAYPAMLTIGVCRWRGPL